MSVDDTAVYDTGYISENGSQWQQFSLTGDRVRGDWVLGSASSSVDLSSVRYVAVFSCTWNGAWDCSDSWQVRDRGVQNFADSQAGDQEALQALYDAANGAGWSDNTGWRSSGMDLSDEIYGVSVEDIDGELRVTELDLKDNGLSGDIEVEQIANLRELVYFNVAFNGLHSGIPQELMDLPNLRYVYLSLSDQTSPLIQYDPHEHTRTGGGDIHPGKDKASEENVWTGAVPAPSNPASSVIEWFFLSWTDSSTSVADGISSVPAEFFDIPTMVGLQMTHNNNLADLSFPSGIVSMSGLEYLDLSAGQSGWLTGSMHPDFGLLPKMRYFRLNDNEDLTIDFDEIDFSGMSDLRMFSVKRTRTTGSLPVYFFDGTMPLLHAMILSWTESTGAQGPFPEVDPVMDMHILQFNNNGLTSLPASVWTSNTKIIQPNFWDNQLTTIGTTDLTQQDRLRYLRLGGNELHEPWPVLDWDSQDDLQNVYLDRNRYVFKHMLYVPDNAPGGETIFELYQQAVSEGFSYSPQKPFGEPTTRSVSIGGSITLDDFSSVVEHPDNVYQWRKDGDAISGATSRELTISDAQESDAGEYVLRVTNPGIPDLTLTSEPVTVRASSGPDSKSGDEDALEALYSSTNGASWSNDGGWSSSGLDLNDNIFGITTQTIDGEPRVTKIDLVANNLDGQLPEALANLKQATRLDVKRNQLSGELPDGIGEMRKLRYLSLSGRNTDEEEFDGVHAYNKKHGGRATNQYIGGLPDTYYDLVDLEFFELDGQDKQFGGTLGPGVGNWTKLKRIFIQGNLWYETREDQHSEPTAWGGTIPSEVKAWKDNDMFIAGDNKWTGIALDAFEGWNDIPRRIAFGIDGQGTPEEFRQPLPDMSHLSKIEYLSIGHIPWTGPYPGYLHDFEENGFIKLDWAEFDDQDLPPFDDMGDLFRLDFSYMTTDGVLFPPGTDVSGDMNRMILFSVRQSNLKGVIPDGMDTWDRLRYVRFHSTDIEGPLPQNPPGHHSASLAGAHFWNMPNLRGGIPAAWGEMGSTEPYGGVIESGTITDFGTDANGDHWVEDDSKNWATDELVGGPGHNGPQVRYPDATFAHNRKILSNTNNRIYYAYDHIYKDQPLTNLQIGGDYDLVWNSNDDIRPLNSVSFSGSNLDGLIEPGAAPKNMVAGGTYDVRNNQLTFVDLVPSMQEFQDVSSQNGWDYRYAPHKPFGSARTVSLSPGQSFEQDFLAEVPHSDNVYQWRKDGSDLSGEDGPVLSIASVSEPDEGMYTLVVTNPGAPDLTLESQPVTISVS